MSCSCYSGSEAEGAKTWQRYGVPLGIVRARDPATDCVAAVAVACMRALTRRCWTLNGVLGQMHVLRLAMRAVISRINGVAEALSGGGAVVA